MSSYIKINHESLVGKVTLKSVSLYRAVPMENNTFLPVFKGEFTTTNGQTILKGKWTYHWFAKLFVIGFISAILYNLLNNVFNYHIIPIPSIVLDALVVYAMWFLYKKGRKRSVEDKNWIIKYVEHILNS